MLAHSHVSSVPGGFIWPPDTVCTWYIHILYVFSLKRKSSVAPFSFVNTYCFHVLLGLMVHSRFLILAADLGDLNCSERGSAQTTALRMIELVQNFVWNVVIRALDCECLWKRTSVVGCGGDALESSELVPRSCAAVKGSWSYSSGTRRHLGAANMSDHGLVLQRIST